MTTPNEDHERFDEDEEPRRFHELNWGPPGRPKEHPKQSGARGRGQRPVTPPRFVLKRPTSPVRPGAPDYHNALQQFATAQRADDGFDLTTETLAVGAAAHGHMELPVAIERDDAAPVTNEDTISIEVYPAVTVPAMVKDGNGLQDEEARNSLLLDIEALKRAAAKPDDPVFGPMAPGIVALVVGEAGVGKSIFKVTAAVAVAGGVEFAGIKPPRPQPVVIYSPEDSSAIIGRRILAACQALGADHEVVKQNLTVVTDAQPFILFEQGVGRPTVSQIGQRVIAAAKKRGARMLVLDPLVELHTASENDNGQMHGVFSEIRGMAREMGCTALVGHHITKDKGTPRGAGSITGTIRVMIHIDSLTKEEAAPFEKMGKNPVNLIKVRFGKDSHNPLDTTVRYFERVSVTVEGHSAPALRQLKS